MYLQCYKRIRSGALITGYGSSDKIIHIWKTNFERLPLLPWLHFDSSSLLRILLVQ